MTSHFPLLSILLALLVAATARAADLYPDDVGDEPTEASVFSVGTGAVQVAGIMLPDTDVDWFRFTALPGLIYQVAAHTAGVWDVALELRAPDGQTLWSQTNSAFSGPPVKASITWTNPGAAGPCYVGVRGYLDFTTGSYQLVVSPLNFVDADGDGLPDAWEVQHFGTLTNGASGDNDSDGVSNLNEFYGLTQPTNGTSRFAITSITQVGGTAVVAWAAAPWAHYRVDGGTNLAGAQWYALTNRLRAQSTAGTETHQVPVPLTGTANVFRVEYLISP